MCIIQILWLFGCSKHISGNLRGLEIGLHLSMEDATSSTVASASYANGLEYNTGPHIGRDAQECLSWMVWSLQDKLHKLSTSNSL